MKTLTGLFKREKSAEKVKAPKSPKSPKKSKEKKKEEEVSFRFFVGVSFRFFDPFFFLAQAPKEEAKEEAPAPAEPTPAAEEVSPLRIIYIHPTHMSF